MATKTITIKEEAYNRLKNLKHEESFSDVILDLTKEKNVDLMESFGKFSEEEAKEAGEKIREFRDKFNEDADKALRS